MSASTIFIPYWFCHMYSTLFGRSLAFPWGKIQIKGMQSTENKVIISISDSMIDHRCSQFRATYLLSSCLVHKDKLFSTSHPESGDESFLEVF